MPTLCKTAWILAYRICDPNRRADFVRSALACDGRVAITDAVIIIKTAHTTAPKMWPLFQSFFSPGDRCVVFYNDKDGEMIEVVMYDVPLPVPVPTPPPVPTTPTTTPVVDNPPGYDRFRMLELD